MSSKQQIAVGVDVTASGTHITLVTPTDTGHMEVIYSEFHPMPPAQRQRAQGDGWIPVSERLPSVAQEVIVNSEFDGVTAGFLDSYGEWYAPNSDYKLTRVVAWQPLPAAPTLAASTGQEGGKA